MPHWPSWIVNVGIDVFCCDVSTEGGGGGTSNVDYQSGNVRPAPTTQLPKHTAHTHTPYKEMKMYISRFPRRFTTLTPHTPPPQPAVPKIAQAPNRLTPWNTTQTEKDKVMKKEARFNQTDISKQVWWSAWMSLHGREKVD